MYIHTRASATFDSEQVFLWLLARADRLANSFVLLSYVSGQLHAQKAVMLTTKHLDKSSAYNPFR